MEAPLSRNLAAPSPPAAGPSVAERPEVVRPDEAPGPERRRPPATVGPARGVVDSFRYAWNGMLVAAVRQRNMKIHLTSGLMVGLVGSAIPLGLAEKVTLIFCVMLVIFAEILNASLEALVDLHTEKFHHMAKVAKDTAAAGVLVLAIGTVVIFAALIVHNWPTVAENLRAVLRQIAAGLPLTILMALLLWTRTRPRWVNHLIFVAGAALLALTATWTTSVVFTCLTAGLFAFARAVAARTHELSR